MIDEKKVAEAIIVELNENNVSNPSAEKAIILGWVLTLIDYKP